MEEMPDAELIRYYLVGNMERVLVVSPKALSEVLTLKSYDFRKPDLARISLERITGNGVLLAEGDEHKVGSNILYYPVLGTFSSISLTSSLRRDNGRISCLLSLIVMLRISTQSSGPKQSRWSR